MEEKTAIAALKEIKEVLDKHGIEFWLESGVILGAIRNQSFIPWDYDIDLGTWEENTPKMKTLTNDFCDKGYETYFSPYHNLLIMKKGEIDVQLVFWRIDNGNAVAPLRYIENSLGFFLSAITWALLFSHYGKANFETLKTITKSIQFFLAKLTDKLPESLRLMLAILLRKIAINTGNRRGLVVTPSHFFLNLSEINFYNMIFKVPSESEAYLAYYYGEDWRIPKKDWIYVRKDRKLISKTERIGEKWHYLSLSKNPAFVHPGNNWD